MPDLEQTLDITVQPDTTPVSREELVEFVRCIAEGEPLFTNELIQGQRAIELAAWNLYRRLQESHEL